MPPAYILYYIFEGFARHIGKIYRRVFLYENVTIIYRKMVFMRILIFIFSLLVSILLLVPALVCGTSGEEQAENTMQNAVQTIPQDVIEPVTPDHHSSPDSSSVTEETDTAEPASQPELSPVISFLSQKTVSFEEDGSQTEIALDTYVQRVLWAEVPASFSDEAWRALAVAIRTYAVYCHLHGLVLSSDSAVCCAYLTEEDAAIRFGDRYDQVYRKAESAVRDTAGEVLLWEGTAACTMFHAMSYQNTASAESVLGNAVPYLVSVPTPEPRDMSGMMTTAEFHEASLKTLLNVEQALPLTVEEDEEGRVRSVLTADGHRISGTEFRQRLSLRSTNFKIDMQDASLGQLSLQVFGYGHGVGMSQWGAEYMAQAGNSYGEILAHYYPGCERSVNYVIP